MVGSPLGGAHGKGCVRQTPKSRRALGFAGRAPGWGGGRQAASKQRASKKANIWELPGGRTGRGAYGKPQSPLRHRGLWGLPGAPLGGAGVGKQRASNEQARRQMFGSPLGGAREGVRTASPFRPEGRMGLTGRDPGWGGGKLQQARLLCPRCAGAKGVGFR